MQFRICSLFLLAGIFSCSEKQQPRSIVLAVAEELNAADLEKIWPVDSARAYGAKPEPVDLYRAAYCALKLEKELATDELIKKGLTIIPKDNPFYNEMIVLRGHLAAYQGNYAAAQYDYKTVLASDPVSYTALTAQAFLAAFHGDHAMAIRYARQVLKIFPSDSIALNNLSYSCTETRRFKEAIKYGMEGLTVAKGNNLRGSLLNNTGYAIGLSGDFEKGLAMIEESLQLRPDNAYAWCNKGAILLELGRKEEACAAFQTANKYGGEKMTERYIAENCQ